MLEGDLKNPTLLEDRQAATSEVQVRYAIAPRELLCWSVLKLACAVRQGHGVIS